MLPAFQPIPVTRRPRPFNDSQWLFELKYDGFRALAYLDNGRCRLVSRNGHAFGSFAELASSITTLADVTTAIFDGEIVCVDAKGRPRFNDLLFRRRDPVFFAFDLLYLNGKDLRYEQLTDRKAALRQVLNSRTFSGMHYADDISGTGVALYERVCEMDLEGIVAKHKTAPYLSYHAISSWYKIKNPRYSQMAGRHELF
jgi:bifunctional non-homologous end joining protein LigD